MNGTDRSSAVHSPGARMTESEKRTELEALRARRPDIEHRAAATVIVDIPTACRPVQIAVNHRPWGQVEVDYREQSDHAWVPIAHVGGSFEERAR